MDKKVEISASLLSANFLDLKTEIDLAIDANVDSFHLDIMDGCFVPNFGIGIGVIEALQGYTDKALHAHLMVQSPETCVESVMKTNVSSISFHIESFCNKYRLSEKIRSANKKVGIAINLDTNPEDIRYHMEYTDYVIIMLVHPGFSGQKAMSKMEERIKTISSYRKNLGHEVKIVCDGGINTENAQKAISSGADVLVAGSSIFGQSQNLYGQIVSSLRGDK